MYPSKNQENYSWNFLLIQVILKKLREASTWGIVDGVTTNPSLIAKTGRTQHEVINDIVNLIDGSISAEVLSTEKEGMLQEAATLAEIHPNVVIKLPLTVDGLLRVKNSQRKTLKQMSLFVSP